MNKKIASVNLVEESISETIELVRYLISIYGKKSSKEISDVEKELLKTINALSDNLKELVKHAESVESQHNLLHTSAEQDLSDSITDDEQVVASAFEYLRQQLEILVKAILELHKVIGSNYENKLDFSETYFLSKTKNIYYSLIELDKKIQKFKYSTSGLTVDFACWQKIFVKKGARVLWTPIAVPFGIFHSAPNNLLQVGEALPYTDFVLQITEDGFTPDEPYNVIPRYRLYYYRGKGGGIHISNGIFRQTRNLTDLSSYEDSKGFAQPIIFAQEANTDTSDADEIVSSFIDEITHDVGEYQVSFNEDENSIIFNHKEKQSLLDYMDLKNYIIDTDSDASEEYDYFIWIPIRESLIAKKKPIKVYQNIRLLIDLPEEGDSFYLLSFKDSWKLTPIKNKEVNCKYHKLTAYIQNGKIFRRSRREFVTVDQKDNPPVFAAKYSLRTHYRQAEKKKLSYKIHKWNLLPYGGRLGQDYQIVGLEGLKKQSKNKVRRFFQEIYTCHVSRKKKHRKNIRYTKPSLDWDRLFMYDALEALSNSELLNRVFKNKSLQKSLGRIVRLYYYDGSSIGQKIVDNYAAPLKIQY